MKYIVSDIHGNRDALLDILKQIDFNQNDELYVLGDVVDRNPYGIEIIQWIMDTPNVHMLLGNHEYMMMMATGHNIDHELNLRNIRLYDIRSNWYDNGGKVTHNALMELEYEDMMNIFNFIESLPLNIEVEVNGHKFILCHAAPEFIYDEYEDVIGGTKMNFCVWDRDILFNADIDDDVTVICGHTPTRMFQHTDQMEIFRDGKVIDIDCGAAYVDSYSGRLACIRLDDMQVFYSAK